METDMKMVPEYFASHVFDDITMRARLPKETYKAMVRTIKDGRSLDITIRFILLSSTIRILASGASNNGLYSVFISSILP